MKRFANLLDSLAYEPARNNKLRLITAYFRSTPDPERGWALAALTRALSFPHANAALIGGALVPAVRSAAVSALASQLLARSGARPLALLGGGGRAGAGGGALRTS